MLPVFKTIRFLIFLLLIISLNLGFSQDKPSMPPPIEESAKEPVIYTGEIQTNKRYYDGAIRHVVGVHHYQVMRANRSFPPEGGDQGWTYNHQPYLAYWNGKYYLQYLSGMYEEHSPPTRLLICISEDGRNWSDPKIVFPEYELPEIQTDEGFLPAGTKSVLHQRMGFYVAPNGRLLTSGFYSYCFDARHSPNRGQGLGRVVREVYADGSFGPIYFVRYNRHAGFNEKNTNYRFYKESTDSGFVNACDSLLADKLITLQWWEEDRGTDGFFAIDPSQVDDPSAVLGSVTTSAGAGKAFCFYHRPDGVVVGIWKNQYSGLSPDNGKTWTPLVKNRTLNTCGAKVWGQMTDDGKYVLVYNHSATRRNRFPMVIVTSNDGHTFRDMFCWEGEVPPQRYQGIHRNPGPQYIRGIMEGNGDPPGQYLWNTYSMNKEDIWVARTTVPVMGTVSENVNEDFDLYESEADLESWNLYMPRWAPISIGTTGDKKHNKILELRDEEPYDYALAERAFPISTILEIQFFLHIKEISRGHALEIEVVDYKGSRPMRLRLDAKWLGIDRAQVFPLEPIPINTNVWYTIGLKLDCDMQSYDLALDGDWIRQDIKFAEKVENLERIIFRTGPYRGDVRPTLVEEGEPKPAGLYSEDQPGSEEKVETCRYWIDSLRIESLKK